MSDRRRTEAWFSGTEAAEPDPPAEESTLVARTLTAPETGGISRAGLPIRTPKAHLVPGAFEASDELPAPDRSAEEMRRHLDGYRAGGDRARRSTA